MIDLIVHCGLYCPNWEFIPDYADTTKNRIVLEEEGTRKYLSNFGDGIRKERKEWKPRIVELF